MKQAMRNLLVTVILSALSLGRVHALEPGATLLSDKDLAGIKGGFCFLEKCEDAPGTGNCQPLAPNTTAICAFTLCQFEDDTVLNIPLYSCGFFGLTTCTKAKTYRQCVLAFTTSTCSDGTTTPCGTNIVPTCTMSIPDRKCTCGSHVTGQTCDWTDCVSGM